VCVCVCVCARARACTCACWHGWSFVRVWICAWALSLTVCRRPGQCCAHSAVQRSFRPAACRSAWGPCASHVSSCVCEACCSCCVIQLLSAGPRALLEGHTGSVSEAQGHGQSLQCSCVCIHKCASPKASVCPAHACCLFPSPSSRC